MLKPGVVLYFVRHGETDWNAIRRYQGQTDVPLNDKGRTQAARNGRVLRELIGERADVDFVASPLLRAAETMSIVRREMGLPPHDFRRDDRLQEIHFGHWEGRIWDVLSVEDPHHFEARQADPFNWRPIGGESYADLAERARRWLAEIERDTVAVSHGGVSRVIRGHILGLPTHEVPLLEVPQDKVLVLRRGSQEWI
ncbi:MAG TPA: histidine phosphatase family protein [Hyphomicrobiaceae bacterium]|nr:histidine phosphatase family protein [Hyphomicrobiaceae bacterium]